MNNTVALGDGKTISRPDDDLISLALSNTQNSPEAKINKVPSYDKPALFVRAPYNPYCPYCENGIVIPMEYSVDMGNGCTNKGGIVCTYKGVGYCNKCRDSSPYEVFVFNKK